MQELDIENAPALEDYLRGTRRMDPGEAVRTRVLAGGVSNRTVLVELPDRGEAWVLKQALAKLRVAVDWFSDPARIRREALGIRWLAKLAPAGCITPLVFEDAEQNLLAMQAVPQPHENWKTMLMAGRIEPGHVEQFGALLGTIHRRSAEAPEPLAQIFDDRSFFESLRLEPYYAYAADHVPDAAEFLGDLIAATRSRRLTLVHGDYSPKNVLVRDGRLILLDHEVIHWGDPAFDVGFALAHFLSKAHRFPACRAQFADAAKLYYAAYAESSGEMNSGKMRVFAAQHTLGCLLARVAGRSPLEYLDDEQRRRQREAVVSLIRQMPENVTDVIDEFLAATC